ncbi:hypothetical protein CE206_28935 (plasmid) [Achromobacter xylosoxidans]|uniref:hypothetical protein n=1 Tax=Alcaligenes xylosoxydans xylosoxydans TaxID=85698 RepID=UPI000DD168C3|nr:hypothetical protein [Achromobacter xylosoxidans]AXA80604.1 hypothetical protein CE206_28935 [Achromobacter xylosoxidans]
MTTTTKILTAAQAQAVYSAMFALDALGPDHGAEFHLGDWVYVRRVHLGGAIRIEDRADGDDECHDDLATFAAAYGFDRRADGSITSNEAHIEAVANANKHLNNACMPTMRDLDQAVTAGAPQVMDFSANGRRQHDFALGWNTAMGRVYDRMRQVILTQRAINNAEQSH